MDIMGTTLRICVDDLEAAVAFYEDLTASSALRFERGGVSVAAIGCFLLMSGPESELEILRKVTATIAVKDVDEAHASLTRVGARILAGPVPTPVGRNLIAVHPDGSVFEYVDRTRPAEPQAPLPTDRTRGRPARTGGGGRGPDGRRRQAPGRIR